MCVCVCVFVCVLGSAAGGEVCVCRATVQQAQPPCPSAGPSGSGRLRWVPSIPESPSKLSLIFSQMMSTSRSNTCFTLMWSLALASKNWNPGRRRTGLRLRTRPSSPRGGNDPIIQHCCCGIVHGYVSVERSTVTKVHLIKKRIVSIV